MASLGVGSLLVPQCAYVHHASFGSHAVSGVLLVGKVNVAKEGGKLLGMNARPKAHEEPTAPEKRTDLNSQILTSICLISFFDTVPNHVFASQSALVCAKMQFFDNEGSTQIFVLESMRSFTWNQKRHSRSARKTESLRRRTFPRFHVCLRVKRGG